MIMYFTARKSSGNFWGNLFSLINLKRALIPCYILSLHLKEERKKPSIHWCYSSNTSCSHWCARQKPGARHSVQSPTQMAVTEPLGLSPAGASPYPCQQEAGIRSRPGTPTSHPNVGCYVPSSVSCQAKTPACHCAHFRLFWCCCQNY